MTSSYNAIPFDNPELYSYNDDDEQSKLDYCIFDHINFYLKRIITIIQ